MGSIKLNEWKDNYYIKYIHKCIEYVKSNPRAFVGVTLGSLAVIDAVYGLLGLGNILPANDLLLAIIGLIAFQLLAVDYKIVDNSKKEEKIKIDIEKKTSAMTSKTNLIDKNLNSFKNEVGNILKETSDITSKTSQIDKNISSFKNQIDKITKETSNLTTKTSKLDENLNSFKNQVDEILKERSDLKKERSNLKVVHELFNAYVSISGKGIEDYKIMIKDRFQDELNSLSRHKCTRELTIGEGHEWSVPILDEIQYGDYVIAVSLLHGEEGEWRNDLVTSWESYINANVKAAKNCRNVRRIFIADKSTLDKCITDSNLNDVRRLLLKHTQAEYTDCKWTESEDVTGIIVNKTICDHKYPALGANGLKNGFILISKNGVRMAVIDKFTDHTVIEKRYKVIITYNSDKLDELEAAFDKIAKDEDIVNFFSRDTKDSMPELVFDLNELKDEIEKKNLSPSKLKEFKDAFGKIITDEEIVDFFNKNPNDDPQELIFDLGKLKSKIKDKN